MNRSRRRFLFIGVAGAAVFAAARWLDPAATGASASASSLSSDGADVVRALVPPLLDGALPDDPGERRAAVEKTVAAVAAAIDGLAPATREELSALFALLAFAPVRILFAGIDGAWRDAGAADVDVFLGRLQKSRWSVKRTAYDALHQLVLAAWYADPRTWPAIGYPGPPALR